MATHPAPDRPLDALAEAFVHLAGHANVNTNQIFVVEGQIDAARLERSVARAVAGIALLQTRADPGAGLLRHAGAAPGQLVWRQDFDGPCDLHDPALRARLMAFSNAARIDWRERAPIQVLLITGKGGASSCVYVSTHHGVADARSDCLLVQAIMRHYAHDGAQAAEPSTPPLPFDAPQRIRPRWYHGAGRVRRWLDAAASVGADLLRRDRGLRVPYQGSRWERHAARADIAELDFFHSVFDAHTEAHLKAAARASGATLNSVLTAALVRTIEHTQREAGVTGGTVRVTCAVSLRRLIEPRYDYSFRNYLVASCMRTRAGQSTAALLRAIGQEVQEARAERRLLRELGRIELLLPLLRAPGLSSAVLRLISRVQGSNACYSNPGVIGEDFSCFGTAAHRTLQYIGFGCVVPPYDFILYTPTVNGRMQLDLVYRRACFPDARAGFIDVFQAELRAILDELAPAPRPPHASPATQPELATS
ncbi:MAG: hypothetical protein ACLGI6_18970 [Gammaproteobacteria bacterium]